MEKFNVKIKCTCVCESVIIADNEKEAIRQAELIIKNNPDNIRGIDLIDSMNKVISTEIVS